MWLTWFIENYIYIYWTLINTLHDFTFRVFLKNNCISPEIVILSRYFFLFSFGLFSFVFNTLFYKKYIPKLLDILYMFLRSISTFFGFYFSLKQFQYGSMLNTSLIFYSIPSIDYICYCLFNFNTVKKQIKDHLYKNIYLVLNLIIFIYYFNTYSSEVYIYGYMSSICYSICNIFLLKIKPDKSYLSFDLTISGLCMFIFTYIFFKASKANIYNIYLINWQVILLSVLGLCIGILLYKLFLNSKHKASTFIAHSDLVVSGTLDLYFFNENPDLIVVILICILIILAYIKNKIKKFWRE